MKILAAITLILFTTLGCNTTNPDNNLVVEAPSTPNEYSKKTVDAITSGGANELTYVFKGYEQAGNKVYIKVHAFGDSTNIEMPILVKQWSKLEGVKETKGVGYHGAELSGLQLAMTNDEIAKFEYKTLSRIID